MISTSSAAALLIFHLAFATDPNLLAVQNCALRIINYRMEQYAFVISASNNSLLSLITQRMSNVCYVLINLDTISQLQLFSWKARLYVVIIDQLKQYESFLNLFYRAYVWNPRGTFFVIYLGEEDLSGILKMSWKHYVLHIYILDKSLSLRSYLPYKRGKCGEMLQQEEICKCNELTTAAVNHIYTNKVPNQFNKCPFSFLLFRIAPFIIKLEGDGEVGFEMEMLRVVAHYTNTTLVFVNHSHREWGVKMVNDKYIHMVGDLEQRKINGIAGMVPATAELRILFDATPVHSLEKSVIFVPAGKHIDGWKNLQTVYKQEVWISLLVVFSGVSFALWLGAMVHQKCEDYRRLDYWFLYALCASCSSLPRLPRLLFFRYIIYMWVCFFFVLSSVFQCQLLTFLVKPSFEREISSFEEWVASGLPIGGYYTVVAVIEDSEVELHQQLNRKWVNCSLELRCVTRTAKKRDFCTVHGERTVQYEIPKKYLYPNGVAKIKSLPDKRFPFGICFYVDKGLPYYEKMQKLIIGLLENGLFAKWRYDLQYQQKTVPASKEMVQINIHHLILPFVFLIVGHLIASCVLILELVYYNKRVKRQYHEVSKITWSTTK